MNEPTIKQIASPENIAGFTEDAIKKNKGFYSKKKYRKNPDSVTCKGCLYGDGWKCKLRIAEDDINILSTSDGSVVWVATRCKYYSKTEKEAKANKKRYMIDCLEF